MIKKRKQFGKLYDKYIKEIYRFIYLKVSSQSIAEDLTSETFRKGWESFKQEKTIDNTRAFLYQIARNLIIDYYRVKKEHISINEINLPDNRQSLEEKISLKRDIEKVKSALRNINSDYQDIIIFRYLEELEIEEVAKLIGKSEGAVRVMTHRAITALEKEIKKNTKK